MLCMDKELETSFENVCDILAEVWLERGDVEYADFFAFHLLGVTLAYCHSEALVTDLSLDAVDLIEEAFDVFLDEHEIDDIGFSTLEEIWEEVKSNE